MTEVYKETKHPPRKMESEPGYVGKDSDGVESNKTVFGGSYYENNQELGEQAVDTQN